MTTLTSANTSEQTTNASTPEVTASNQSPRLTVLFMLLSVLFVVCLIISNLIEIKTITVGSLTLTAGIAVFPISYIINDCIVEVYGFRKARLTIWTGFAMSLLTALFLQLAIALPGSNDWNAQHAMELIYGSVPRIMFASFAAFICGSMVNAYVMSRMKARAGESRDSRLSFSIRAIASTLWGESIDSLIFFPIAFGGVLPWATVGALIVSQALLKTAYETAVLPVTIAAVGRLKRMERLNTVDTDINYNWWHLTDI